MATVVTSMSKTNYRGQDLCRKRFYNTDFSGQDLSKLKLRNSLFYQCNFNEADLSDTDCEGSEFIGSTFKNTNCYRTNFRDAKLAASVFEPKDCFGMTLTLQCSTFRQMRTSPIWWHSWLFLATLMQPANLSTDELIGVIGAEQYVRLKHLFGQREL